MGKEKRKRAQSHRIFALIGKGEAPADGVADYCNNLSEAFARSGIKLEIIRVTWFEHGWISTITKLCRAIKPGSGDWVLLQYTALGWSRRGFPFGALFVMAALRLRGLYCGVVMHEPWHQGIVTPRLIDKGRIFFQDLVIRSLHFLSVRTVFTIPIQLVGWLSYKDRKSVFIPLGSNVCETLFVPYPPRPPGTGSRIISVFCLSGLPVLLRELGDIYEASCVAASAGLRVRIIFLGRGTEEAAKEISRTFAESEVRTEILGHRDPQEIADVIAHSDVLLCVRGTLNLRRGSALAGIACGVPVVGYSGDEMGTPLVEAGLSLVLPYDRAALGAALTRVLTDETYARELHLKNIATQRNYFSWDVIARQFAIDFELCENEV
jgi:hypothetical protein